MLCSVAHKFMHAQLILYFFRSEALILILDQSLSLSRLTTPPQHGVYSLSLPTRIRHPAPVPQSEAVAPRTGIPRTTNPPTYPPALPNPALPIPRSPFVARREKAEVIRWADRDSLFRACTYDSGWLWRDFRGLWPELWNGTELWRKDGGRTGGVPMVAVGGGWFRWQRTELRVGQFTSYDIWQVCRFCDGFLCIWFV